MKRNQYLLIDVRDEKNKALNRSRMYDRKGLMDMPDLVQIILSYLNPQDYAKMYLFYQSERPCLSLSIFSQEKIKRFDELAKTCVQHDYADRDMELTQLASRQARTINIHPLSACCGIFLFLFIGLYGLLEKDRGMQRGGIIGGILCLCCAIPMIQRFFLRCRRWYLGVNTGARIDNFINSDRDYGSLSNDEDHVREKDENLDEVSMSV